MRFTRVMSACALMFVSVFATHVQAARPVFTQPVSAIKLAEDNRLVLDPALTAAAHSSNPQDRKNAAIAYGRIMKKEGITPLVSLLQDSDTQVAEAAIFALGQLGWQSASTDGQADAVIQKIDAVMPSLSTHLKSVALDAIAKLGPSDAFAHFIPYFSDSHLEIRRSAALSVYRYSLAFRNRSATAAYPVFPDAIVTALLPLTSDRDFKVRENATLALSKMKSTLALSALQARVSDSNLWTRFYALQGLENLVDVSSKAVLLSALNDSAYSIRLEAVVALQKIKAVSELPARLAQDSSVHVRTAYVNALASDANTPDAAIEPFLNDSSRMVRAAATTAFANRKKDQDLATFISHELSDLTAWVRVTATDFVKGLPDAETRLTALLNDPEVTVRAEAANELSNIDTASAKATLQDLMLHSPDLSVRYTAFGILSSDPATAPPVSVFAECYQNSVGDSKWVDLRTDLILYLSSITSNESTLALTSALQDPVAKNAYLSWQELSKRSVTGLAVMDAPLPVRGPDANLVFTRDPQLVLETSHGRVTIELYSKLAQLHVAKVVAFAEQGGYTNLPWHRIVSDFVAQGGDPDRSGFGGSTTPLRAEINPVLFDRGTLGMPRSSDFDSGGVQLFITHVPTPNLDGLYTVFGKVISGMSVVDQLEPGDLILSAQVIR